MAEQMVLIKGGSLLQPLCSLMDNCYEVRNYSYVYRYNSTLLTTSKKK
jgi:hypothetical protein